MSVEYINQGEYFYITNRIALWLIRNNKQFKTRNNYGYFGREADLNTIQTAIKDRGDKVALDPLITEFVECAIVDNTDYSFLPNYVTCSDGKTKIDKATYIDMCKRFSKYEVDNGRSPSIVYLKAPNSSSSSSSSTSELKPYLTNSGCSGMGQCTGYYCACNSLQQAFYRLTGILVAESTIASWAGTTSNGTSHSGIDTAVAKFNNKYNKNLKIQWKNFSDLGWSKIQEYINQGAVFAHLLYRNQWGHYEPIKSVNSDNLSILNSLGEYCNYPAYCGYIETRSKSTQIQYMNGISQKSICIITR